MEGKFVTESAELTVVTASNGSCRVGNKCQSQDSWNDRILQTGDDCDDHYKKHCNLASWTITPKRPNRPNQSIPLSHPRLLLTVANSELNIPSRTLVCSDQPELTRHGDGSPLKTKSFVAGRFTFFHVIRGFRIQRSGSCTRC